jgi:hypothetical protein
MILRLIEKAPEADIPPETISFVAERLELEVGALAGASFRGMAFNPHRFSYTLLQKSGEGGDICVFLNLFYMPF